MTMGGEEGLGVTTGQPNLYKQDLSKLDVNKLTALSREVISRQATINIGTIGHVAHGKSTIVKAISGVQTVRFKNELERNITIKLDTRVAQTNSKERADSLGSSNEMPSTSEKRPISPGSIQPRTKQRKLNENVTLCKKEEVFDSLSISSNKDTSVNLNDTAECQEHNSKESCMDVTKSHNNTRSTTQQKLKYNSNNLQLKELRIVLKDINRDGKVDECALQQDFCEVEQILKKKKCDGIVYYLIKWKNWSLEYNTWEPATNLINCSDLLVDFENSIKKEMLKLLENFKRRVNFYPRQSDVTEFFNKMRKNGTTIDRMLIEEEEVYRSVKIFYKQKFIKNGRFERSVKKNILYLMLSDLRKSQLNSLKEWENEMNSITKCKPLIRVENLVDLESAPRKFFYIKNYLPGNGVIIPEDPPIGCECINCHASKADCCSSQCDAIFPYTTTGKIRVPPGTPVYECNKRCSCNMNCLNRVVQRGTEMHFCVFRTANGRGWGVKTLKSIKKGSFVTQYVGEVITNEEAEKRGQQYDAAGRTYLFDLDYNETEGQCPYTVDAGIYGNISHFINHSCDPNLVVYAVWINCLDPNLPNIALFATRDIKQNEEITFDYMCQAFKNNEKMIGQKTQNKNKFNLNASSKLYETLDIHSRASESDIVTSRTLCKCGAKTCRKYLF